MFNLQTRRNKRLTAFQKLQPMIGNVAILNDSIYIYEMWDYIPQNCAVLVLDAFDVESGDIFQYAIGGRANCAPVSKSTLMGSGIVKIYIPSHTLTVWI